MSEENVHQITRKDAKNCFVESLNDAFQIGKIHLNFATYDLTKPVGSRQTNNVSIYIPVEEFLELCRKLNSGQLGFILSKRKENKDGKPIYQTLGGTSAKRLKALGKARKDGKSLSRVASIVAGQKCDFLFVADSGPGEENEKGLIVPKFGSKPENHVAVSMTFESLSELLLITQVHYQAWLTSTYLTKKNKSN